MLRLEVDHNFTPNTTQRWTQSSLARYFRLLRFLLYTSLYFSVWDKWIPKWYCTPGGKIRMEFLPLHPDWVSFIEFSLSVIFLVKCVNVFSLNLTAVFLVSTVVTVSLAVTVPAFWYTLVHGSATVVLWLPTGFRFWGQKQNRNMTQMWSCTINREIRPVTTIVQWLTYGNYCHTAALIMCFCFTDTR